MRKIKRVLRLTFEEEWSQKAFARSTAGRYLDPFPRAGGELFSAERWYDKRLERALYTRPQPTGRPGPLPDWREVYREPSKKKAKRTTLQLL